ncbi:10893_t:CDS:2 [Funneliformis geosporum]|nr:10893_t:CDS:2 [Funneliformis geosporum]
MAIENEGSTERINEMYRYILHLYSRLINGQKALVTLMDIQVFFDILVPDGETPDKCEEKGYHSKKKSYLRIYTNDHTLVLTWDIETQSQELGEFAEVLNLNNNVFMISMTLHWKDDPKPLKQISFATDIYVGFNDFDYDWCFIMERAYHLNILEWMWERITGKFETKEEILKWKYRGKIGAKSENDFVKKHPVKTPEEGEEDLEEKEYMGGPIRIKISAEDYFISSFLKLPSCSKRKTHLNSSYKNSVLTVRLICYTIKCGKSIQRRRKAQSSSTARYMREVAQYCIIDILYCQELLVNQSIINDYREVASIAYIFLFDTHYRANGMKVRNLLSACAIKRDMVISTRLPEDIEKGKYPDAYVFSPKKGIMTERPVTDLDFASLYSSIIMAYKISPEKSYWIEKRLIMSAKMRTSFIRLSLNSIKDLSKKRLELKARLAPLGKKKQYLEKMISSAKKRGKRVSESLNSEYSSVCFDYDYWDSKQKALKVYMNTFYEEVGNSKSPIFLRELACETTTADRYYKKCDKAFSRKKLSKEAYWTEMVKITMDMMKKLRDQVNAYLRIKSEMSYLKMAYEEVLFPICFTGKKKYFGVGHEDVINFEPKNLFMKEIDIVKQDKS